MPHIDVSIPALLRTRATEQPDVTAYTFMDGSGKIRRSSCGELSRRDEFQRLDIAV